MNMKKAASPDAGHEAYRTEATTHMSFADPTFDASVWDEEDGRVMRRWSMEEEERSVSVTGRDVIRLDPLSGEPELD